MYNTYTLPNGLRIIQRPSEGDVIYCGYAIATGTRDEMNGEEGLAHFCEHASFKGTQRRKSSQIIRTLEELGGELNAYTNKESTVYYCAIRREHLALAIDLLTDMVFHSVFPEHELEKEKEVICDEIESYNDTPADLIYDDFENIIFSGHPLGHNILGTKETVRAFGHDDAMRFTRRHYTPQNTIFFLHGDPKAHTLRPADTIKPVIKAIEKAFKKYPLEAATNGTENTMPGNTASVNGNTASGYNNTEGANDSTEGASDNTEATVPGGSTARKSPSPHHATYHQAHVIMGREAYGIHHPHRLALSLLNNILGGPAMSSRLNMALRERNGLVYTVESSMTAYGDTGIWAVYFGCDTHDVKRCQRLVRRELDKLMTTPLSPRQLEQAKRQMKGQIALSIDSRESFALDFAKSFLFHGWEKNVEELYRNIDALTADELQTVAQEIFAREGMEVLEY
ncbi:MAG: M16 family metallopeptidase [Prevotella sp.]